MDTAIDCSSKSTLTRRVRDNQAVRCSRKTALHGGRRVGIMWGDATEPELWRLNLPYDDSSTEVKD